MEDSESWSRPHPVQSVQPCTSAASQNVHVGFSYCLKKAEHHYKCGSLYPWGGQDKVPHRNPNNTSANKCLREGHSPWKEVTEIREERKCSGSRGEKESSDRNHKYLEAFLVAFSLMEFLAVDTCTLSFLTSSSWTSSWASARGERENLEDSRWRKDDQWLLTLAGHWDHPGNFEK